MSQTASGRMIFAVRLCAFLAVSVVAGRAMAQSCAPSGPQAVRCRFLLTQPGVLIVTGRAMFGQVRPRPAFVAMRIEVDGRTCLDRSAAVGWITRGASETCRISLSGQPSDHVIDLEAKATTAPERLEVSARPSGRLASLPQEAGQLDSHVR